MSLHICALRGRTTQRHGVVSLASFTRGAEAFMRKEGRAILYLIKRFFKVVPMRWTAAHLCIPNEPVYRAINPLIIFFLGLNGRRMLRVHAGTPVECDYNLRSFGIPTDDIPRTNTGSIKLKNHTTLIKVQMNMDAFLKEARETGGDQTAGSGHGFEPGIECPEIKCVLFGRYAWDHPGNIEFRGLLQDIEK